MPCTSCLYGKWVEYVCVLADLEYLSILFCAVLWAAAPDLVAVLPMWDSAYVFGTATFQAIGFPMAHGRRVVESGRLLSSGFIPHQADWRFNCWRLGSLDRSPQDVIQMTVTLLSGALLQQDSPCSPRASTALPHTHVCGSQALEPNLWATATLVVSSDSLSQLQLLVACVASHQSVERPQQEVWLCLRQMELLLLFFNFNF